MNQRSSFRGTHRANPLTARYRVILITPPCKQTSNHAISTTDSGRCLRSFIRKPENDEYETHSTGNHQSLVLTRANNAGNPQTGAAKRTSDQTAFFGNG
jgi:hypothetical protein